MASVIIILIDKRHPDRIKEGGPCIMNCCHIGTTYVSILCCRPFCLILRTWPIFIVGHGDICISCAYEYSVHACKCGSCSVLAQGHPAMVSQSVKVQSVHVWTRAPAVCSVLSVCLQALRNMVKQNLNPPPPPVIHCDLGCPTPCWKLVFACIGRQRSSYIYFDFEHYRRHSTETKYQ